MRRQNSEGCNWERKTPPADSDYGPEHGPRVTLWESAMASVSDMPKVAGDPRLQTALREFVAANGGKVAVAARLLGVDKTLLWRYYSHGVALPRNEQLIRDALSANRGLASETPPPSTRQPLINSEITQPDIAKIRSFLHHLTSIIDAYEVSLLATPTESQLASAGLSRDGRPPRSPQ